MKRKRHDIFFGIVILSYTHLAYCNDDRMDTHSWVKPYDQNDPKVKYLIPNPLEVQIRLVGAFLAAHKYYEIDRRYTFKTDEFEKPKFFKHFPTPSLRSMHSVVQRACDKGVLPCLTEISRTANISGSLLKLYPPGTYRMVSAYYPFSSARELFKYRVSASYYMCWYTELESEPLALPGLKDCFQDLSKTREADGNNVIQDFRSSYGRGKGSDRYPFTCAYLWFCPDPCYGKSTNGNVKSINEGKNDPKNPCKDLKDKSCRWLRGKNKNFNDLMKNRFNYTCECKTERKGFDWNPMYRLCVDIDECYTKKGNCVSDKICRNTVGSFKCTCRRGFYLNTTTNNCQYHNLLRPTASRGLETRKKPKTEKESTFWLYVDFVLGLGNSATFLMPNIHLLFSVLCICFHLIS